MLFRCSGQEFPDARYIQYPDYPVPFSSGHLFVPKFCAAIPFMLQATVREHETLEAILAKDRYDLVISDNRLGVFSSEVPSIFISHQLHYHLPLLYWPGRTPCHPGQPVPPRAVRPHRRARQSPGPALPCRKLSRPDTDVARDRAFFSGILTGTRQIACTQDLDYLVIISGPEPQRTILEKIILEKLEIIGGSGIVLLGSPQSPKATTRIGDWTCVSYVSTEEKAELMNRARCVICRSGYTTLMELADGKTGALDPDPGADRAGVLSWYCSRRAGIIRRTRTAWISQTTSNCHGITRGSRRCHTQRRT